jgi:3-oxoacyl-[acyl-carrier protein] reductase
MDERTAVVTGGGTGIGRAITAALAEQGQRVVVVGRRFDVLQACANELTAAAGKPASVTAFRADLTDVDDVAALAEHVRAELGTLDILVNNAGGSQRGPVDSLADLAAKWRDTMTQNVVSAVITTEALRPLLRRPGGRVVVISSRSARSGGGDSAYASSKAALNRWIVSLASELGGDGITANVVSPGFVPDTELYGDAGPAPEWHARIAKGIAMGRVGEPSDIASVVRYVTSPEAGWVTGTVVEVDGGVRISL